jgi:hypothetical protein
MCRKLGRGHHSLVLFRLILNKELFGVYYPRARVSVWSGLKCVKSLVGRKVLGNKKAPCYWGLIVFVWYLFKWVILFNHLT